MAKSILITVGIVASLVSIAAAIPGIATFYTQYVPSTCYGNQNHGVLVASVNDGLWNNGTACGEKFTVKCTGPGQIPVSKACTGKTVTVTIVEHCTGCPFALVLSKQAFTRIANPKALNIYIDFTRA